MLLTTVLSAYNAPITQDVSNAIDSTKAIAAIITYGNSHIQTSKPCQCHIAGTPEKGVGKASADISHFKTLNYPDLGPFFVVPSHEDFRSSAAAVAHTRCLTFLKPLTGGPYFDLEAIWEEHTMFEFGERAVEKTMGTMVQEPYVNHTPTMTGGIGRDSLTYFYRHHFIFNNPADTALDLVSRTVGIDRVIDEFVAKMTHDRMVDWLYVRFFPSLSIIHTTSRTPEVLTMYRAPGIPPTGKYLEIPFTSVVNIRGDRLYHEHISWDQATLLRQLGLMPEYLPFPYALPDGKLPGEGKRFEYKVPTAGVETARKLVDERAVESNGMFEFEVREVDV